MGSPKKNKGKREDAKGAKVRGEELATTTAEATASTSADPLRG
jgi:hypothetical protein